MRDIVLVTLVTDGQTHAAHLQAAARSGHRLTVVLIGEDSLEANVGTLAALTGGQVFIAGHDVAATVRLALTALHAPDQMLPPAEERPADTEVLVGGMRVIAVLGPLEMPSVAGDLLARALGALAAALALPGLSAEAEAALAEAESLCCHLTSLVADMRPGLEGELVGESGRFAIHGNHGRSLVGAVVRQ